MDKPKFKIGDLVQWKHGTDVGVVVDLDFDIERRTLHSNNHYYALVHWLSGKETKVYEEHNTWHGVIIMARAGEI